MAPKAKADPSDPQTLGDPLSDVTSPALASEAGAGEEPAVLDLDPSMPGSQAEVVGPDVRDYPESALLPEELAAREPDDGADVGPDVRAYPAE